uniref:BPTI/Kunitz inhibitor domain-containing protein n=1 Tax=Amblyomma maculatum TaxID=34609 RepID=G3MQR3_AMBMU
MQLNVELNPKPLSHMRSEKQDMLCWSGLSARSSIGLRRLWLFSVLVGSCYSSMDEDYSEEQWKTRYPPLRCENPPPLNIGQRGHIRSWFYNLTTTRCEPFFRTSKSSKGNSFHSKDVCNKICRGNCNLSLSL